MTEVIRMFDRACDNQAGKLFDEIESENPYSYAVRLHRRASSTCLAERMHASIMGIIAANLLPIGFRGAMAAYESSPRQFPPSGAQMLSAVRHHRRHGRQLAPADQPFRAPSVLDPVR